jgi:hypothetical protein
MYTVASVSLGRAANLGFMVAIAKVWLWVGFAAWVVTLGLMLVSPARSLLGAALRYGCRLYRRDVRVTRQGHR